jgi:hypothetical protein
MAHQRQRSRVLPQSHPAYPTSAACTDLCHCRVAEKSKLTEEEVFGVVAAILRQITPAPRRGRWGCHAGLWGQDSGARCRTW